MEHVPRGSRCINCDYRLDGLTRPTCPECGKPFDARDARTYASPDEPQASEAAHAVDGLVSRHRPSRWLAAVALVIHVGVLLVLLYMSWWHVRGAVDMFFSFFGFE